ncbi:hypothetical protein [Geobacter sulfurreducens]|uniref:hypothetical protein n=1 Tax=Geobacter sulfurreducens TaxID=35554 RepID=UPI0020B72D95|nr:hypothetical protein [Geobacter sulfurreducens]UTG93652.1 hypothetical protein J8622_04820 [Geobacter sulfurreducens]
MKKVLLVGAALMVLSGCTGMATRIKQQNYAYWPPLIQQAVDNGIIIPGMNKLQVLAVTDVPESLVKKRTQFVSNGILETWILYKSMGGYFFSDPGFSSTVIINFRDGVVDSVSF